MTESENSLHLHAELGEGVSKSVCSQVVADESRYSLWISRHDLRMTRVASAYKRDRQLIGLRSVGVEQIHRTALVRYLREYHVKGSRRDETLREFYNACDPQRALLVEHKGYVVAASSQFCAFDLLEMAGDARGLDMLQRYEAVYGHFFSMFCDHARAARRGKLYLLDGLIPEVRDNASKLRARILSGQLLPAQRHAGVERFKRSA